MEETSPKCVCTCVNSIINCCKCNPKKVAYGVCTLALSGFVIFLILCVSIPDEVLHRMYYDDNQNLVYNVTLICVLHMIVTCILLFYGLQKVICCFTRENKSWCVLTWILVMIFYWNVHLACSILSIVKYVVIGLEEEIEKTSSRVFILFCTQVIWLSTIAYMWFYWKTMKEINNVPNIPEYVADRSNSILSLFRQRGAVPPTQENTSGSTVPRSI